MHVVTDRTIQPIDVDPFVLESWMRLSLCSMTRITGFGLLLLVRNGKCFGMYFMAVGTRQAYLVMCSAFPHHRAPTAFGFTVTAETCVNLLRRGRSVGPARPELDDVAKAEATVGAGYMKTPRSVTGFASLLRIRRVWIFGVAVHARRDKRHPFTRMADLAAISPSFGELRCAFRSGIRATLLGERCSHLDKRLSGRRKTAGSKFSLFWNTLHHICIPSSTTD